MSRRRQRLSQQQRHAQILALLRHEGTVRIATLAKAFAITTETARRDLDELAESGALKRTYGGAASRSLIDEPGIGVRGRTHAGERALIARAAAAPRRVGRRADDRLRLDDARCSRRRWRRGNCTSRSSRTVSRSRVRWERTPTAERSSAPATMSRGKRASTAPTRSITCAGSRRTRPSSARAG